jgi:hypothetical protein
VRRICAPDNSLICTRSARAPEKLGDIQKLGGPFNILMPSRRNGRRILRWHFLRNVVVLGVFNTRSQEVRAEQTHYNELVNLTGHANRISWNPTATVHLSKRIAVAENWEFIWRESEGDGIYGVGGNFVRAAHPGDGRYVGSQPTTLVDWAIQRHLGLVFIYAHFYPGAFLQNMGRI